MDIPQDDLDYLNQVSELAAHPVFQQATQMGVPITPDLLQKLAVQAAKPLPLSQGIVTMDAPTGGKLNVDAATREVIDPGKIVQPAKPLAGSQGVTQEQLPDGTYIMRDNATGEKVTGERHAAPTDAQGNAMMFGNRMALAEDVISGIDPNDFNPVGFMDTFGRVPNRIKSEERQRWEAARDNWIGAVLRKESGAVISDAERADTEPQYFPQPGDKPAVVEQKAKLRAKVIADMARLGAPAQAQNAQASSASDPVAGTRTLQPADATALTWANAHPHDPRAAMIKQRLGIR